MRAIRPWLYVGKYRETTDKALLDAYGIGAMLQLAERVDQPGIVSLYLAVEDGQPLPADKLRQGVEFVRAQKAAGHKVLVACGAGISRSVTFATAALKEEENLDLIQAYRIIQMAHPEAMPHDKLFRSLCEYYGEKSALWPPWW